MTLNNDKKQCFFCFTLMPVRSGKDVKVGGKWRFACEQCKNTICRPLNLVDNPLSK